MAAATLVDQRWGGVGLEQRVPVHIFAESQPSLKKFFWRHGLQSIRLVFAGSQRRMR